MDATQPQILTEVEAGKGLTLGQAAKMVPGSMGQKANPSTLFRWVRDGARAVDGRRVHLESLRCGGRILTTQAALRRFMLALSERAEVIPAPRSAAEARRASERAEKRLIEMGC
jgi:Protein of unknown function (DUF1580)